MIFAASCGQQQPKATDGTAVAPSAITEETVSPPAMTEESVAPSATTVLTPSEIGEFVNPVGDNDNFEDDTYPFLKNPNGKYYHFETYVSLGDSPWDTFWEYEETFTATSTLAPSGNTRYDANNLSNGQYKGGEGNDSGNRTVAWCEGVKGYGIGERVNMCIKSMAQYDNDDEIYFTSLMIVNGYAKNETTWKNNTRVKILRLYVGDTYWCDLHLTDVIKPQIFHLPNQLKIYPSKSGKKIPKVGIYAKPANYESDFFPKTSPYQTDLSFEIIEVYPGDKYDDTCITGIAVDVRGGIY